MGAVVWIAEHDRTQSKNVTTPLDNADRNNKILLFKKKRERKKRARRRLTERTTIAVLFSSPDEFI